MGGRTRRAAPGALETGWKHPLWGRPDIPGHRQVHLLVPVPTSSPSLELLVPSSSRDPPPDIRCPQPLRCLPWLGQDYLGMGAGLSLVPGLGVVLSRWGGDAPWSLERRTYRLGQQPPTPPPTLKYI